MGYGAILVPQDVAKEEEKDVDLISSISGKLMSGVDSGGLSINNVTTVMKNTASLIADNTDTLTSKFSGIALSQLLVDGKITNETAYGYLTQGFPKALNQTAIAMGFQSVEQLKTALKAENGVNVGQFINAFQNAGTALSEFFGLKETRDNVEGFDVIEIDVVLSDNRSYQAETPDRRVQSGQTYQEYVHNLPDMFTLSCILQNGRNYSLEDFEDLILNIRDRKIAVNLILGERVVENLIITNFSPQRETADGFSYALEFKKINVGTMEIVQLNIPTTATTQTSTTQSADVVKNENEPNDDKTEDEKQNGWAKAKSDANPFQEENFTTDLKDLALKVAWGIIS